jgi:hypothetical protein
MSFYKKVLILILLVGVLGAGIFVLVRIGEIPEEIETPVAETGSRRDVLGYSVEGRAIEAFSYGTGDTELFFVGGIHGGYEWNSVLLAYEAMDYLEVNSERIPANLTVTVIPSLNPDGVYKIIQKEGRFTAADVPPGDASTGRFNAHGVDLNRNFACEWQSTAVWRGKSVGAGTAVFSEPEAAAFRDFVLRVEPRAVIFWHSQAGAVYAGYCEDGVSPETKAVMNAYAIAAGYPAHETFDAYEVNGDAEGWLATQNIVSLTVELTTHESIEWVKNRAGMEALFSYYGK